MDGGSLTFIPAARARARELPDSAALQPAGHTLALRYDRVSSDGSVLREQRRAGGIDYLRPARGHELRRTVRRTLTSNHGTEHRRPCGPISARRGWGTDGQVRAGRRLARDRAYSKDGYGVVRRGRSGDWA